MEKLFKIKEGSLAKLKELSKLDEGPNSLPRVDFRILDGSNFGFNGMLAYVKCSEERMPYILEKISPFVDKLGVDVERSILKKVSDADNRAAEGFGSIFG